MFRNDKGGLSLAVLVWMFLGMAQGLMASSGLEVVNLMRHRQIEVPSAGILQLSQVGAGAAIEVGTGDCQEAVPDSSAWILEQAFGQRWLVFPAAGTYCLRASLTEGRALDWQRGAFLRAHTQTRDVILVSGRNDVLIERRDFFLPSSKSEAEEVDPDPDKSEAEEVDPDPDKSEAEEVDPDPDKFDGREPTLVVLTARLSSSTKSEAEEVDPDPDKAGSVVIRLALFPRQVAKSEPEEVDPDPDKATAADGLLVVAGLEHLRGLARRSYVSFAGQSSEIAASAALHRWLAAVLATELAATLQVEPRDLSDGLRLTAFEAAR